MDDENSNNDLIQQATTRLRRKQLEEQLSSMMNYMAKVQVQSSYLFEQLASAMTMTEQLKDYDDIEQQHQQMDLLENHFKLHQAMLHHWFPISMDSMVTGDDDYLKEIDPPNLSSFFNNGDNTIGGLDDFDKNAAILNEQWNLLHRYQRRLRVKYHQKRHQQRQRMEDKENVLADLAIAGSSPSTSTADKSTQYHHHHHHHRKNLQPAMLMHQLPLTTQAMTSTPSSPMLSPTKSSSSSSSSLSPHLVTATSTKSIPPIPPHPLSPSCSCQFPYQQKDDHHHHFYYNTKKDNMLGMSYMYGTNEERYDDDDDDDQSDNSSYDTNRSEYSSINDSSPSSFKRQSTLNNTPLKESHDIVFDDTMAFLEQMDNALAGKTSDNPSDEVDGFDDFFFQDMAFLLDHPELCDQPLANLAPLLEQQHQTLSQGNEMNPQILSSESSSPSSPYIYDLCASGIQWCRFLSVLTASTMISLLNGPDDLLIN